MEFKDEVFLGDLKYENRFDIKYSDLYWELSAQVACVLYTTFSLSPKYLFTLYGIKL